MVNQLLLNLEIDQNYAHRRKQRSLLHILFDLYYLVRTFFNIGREHLREFEPTCVNIMSGRPIC